MNIPSKIKEAARSLIDAYGLAFDYLGKYKGKDAYLYRFPADVCTGFPFIYLLKDGKVSEITGFEALTILDLCVKDSDVIGVE